MSKKKNFHGKKPFSKESAEAEIVRIFQQQISPINQRMDYILDQLENVKGNLIVCMDLLEKKKILDKEEFLNSFAVYYESEIGIRDSNGEMSGVPILSIYNMEN